MKRKVLCLFLIVFFLYTLVQAQPSYIFDSLYDSLLSLGQNPQKQYLNDSIQINSNDDGIQNSSIDLNQSTAFPYNVLISVKGNGKYPLHTLVIILPATTSEKYLSEVTQFIDSFKDNLPPYNIDFLFSANDKTSISLEANSYIPSGITTYIQNVSEEESIIAIQLEEDLSETYMIPGCKGKVVPSKYLSSLLSSFEDNKVNVNIKGRFLSFYRLGWLESQSSLSYLIEQGIPAVLLSFNKSSINSLFSVIDNFIRNKEIVDTNNWDSQYSLIKVGFYHIVIQETVMIIMFILFLAVCLFFICGFSFVVSKLSIQRKNEFKKTWYLLPLCILLVTFFLILSQKFTMLILPYWEQNVLLAFIIKFACSLFLLTLVTLISYKINFPLTSFIWGYLLLISSLVNIFLFSLYDLELFLVFSIEFLVILISRSIKKVVPLIIFFILMFIPFFIYLIVPDSESRYQVLTSFVSSSVFMNILLSSLITPFVFAWLRIRVRLKLFGKNEEDKKKKITLFIVSTVVYVFLVLIASFVLGKSQKDIESKEIVTIQDAEYVNVKIDERPSFSNRVNLFMNISSSLPVIRYDIEIVSIESDLVVYSSNYPYDAFSEKGRAVYKLDEYPPNPLQLECVADAKQTIYLKLESYLDFPNNKIVVDKKAILLHRGIAKND